MRNTICAALTTITLALCTALAGCAGMAKASTPAMTDINHERTRE